MKQTRQGGGHHGSCGRSEGRRSGGEDKAMGSATVEELLSFKG